MNKEQIMEAMNHIDPALIEAADRNESTARYSWNKWSRPALIAACLCLLLAGAALAAELSGVRVIEFFTNELRTLKGAWSTDIEVYSGYAVDGDVTYFPIDSLSPEIIELDQTLKEPLTRSFSSWEEMEAFVGINLMDNPVLEEAPAGTPLDWRGDPAEKVYLAHVNTGEGDGVPRIVMEGSYYLYGRKVYHGGGSHWENKVCVTVTAELLTERRAEWDELNGRRHAGSECYYPEEVELTQEDYIAPSGLHVLIFRADYPEIETTMENMETGEISPFTRPAFTSYHAEFLLNGMMFTVAVTDYSNFGPIQASSELVRETLFEVLDGFVYDPVGLSMM